MKKLHVHVAVHDLAQSIRFYKALFDAEPKVRKDDYAKWQLEDPSVNFAISKRGARAGLDRLGIQAVDEAELGALRSQLAQADVSILDQKGAPAATRRATSTGPSTRRASPGSRSTRWRRRQPTGTKGARRLGPRGRRSAAHRREERPVPLHRQLGAIHPR